MIKLPLHVVHNLLRGPVVVFDVVFGRTDIGRQTVAQEADRTVLMGLQPMAWRTVQLLPEGAQSEGAKVVHCDQPLSVADNANGAMSGRQTFIRDNGQILKLMRLQDWSIHSPIGKWAAVKYVNTDGTVT